MAIITVLKQIYLYIPLIIFCDKFIDIAFLERGRNIKVKKHFSKSH